MLVNIVYCSRVFQQMTPLPSSSCTSTIKTCSLTCPPESVVAALVSLGGGEAYSNLLALYIGLVQGTHGFLNHVDKDYWGEPERAPH